MSKAMATMAIMGMATSAYGVAPTADPHPHGPDLPIWTPAPFITPQTSPRFVVWPEPVQVPGARMLPDGCVAIPESELRRLLEERDVLKARLAKIEEAIR